MSEQCSERVYRGREVSGWMCSKPAKVERGGKWYCTVHDPERVAAKQQATSEKYRAEREAEQAVGDEAARLCVRLGGGTPAVHWYTRNFTGGVQLTKEEALALVERLEKVRS